MRFFPAIPNVTIKDKTVYNLRGTIKMNSHGYKQRTSGYNKDVKTPLSILLSNIYIFFLLENNFKMRTFFKTSSLVPLNIFKYLYLLYLT
ncbi:MAG: hypothetical protein DWB56_06810 [Candidatus Jettenia sp.]|nr:MAG: hypothetical protein EDM77_03750 [Candidatus Jettenia sp. AMX1]MBC6928664.1 hypothetical protein [Candidatus Jettenia sp.]MCE7879976.1 hypothetical protein [Candidatus Jettenia sp. AMX1]MCQ3926758.1 hypothetical protein [Candidatus Jettenia sp.]GJQ44277.1 MAG: hypothetical protein JETCAE04_00310 [Candidatus Jettenia caeni]